MTTKKQLLSTRVNNWIIVGVVVVCAVCIGILWILTFDWWKPYPTAQTLLRDIMSFVFTTAVLALLWELLGKRAFLDEILEKAQIAHIKDAGLRQVARSYFDLDMTPYFQTVSKLDVFVAYSTAWRNKYIQELQRLVQRDDVRIRFVLADPDDETTVQELARRFELPLEEIKNNIRRTEKAFWDLRTSGNGASVQIWFLRKPPLFTMYRFDGVGVFVPYGHRTGKPIPDIPAFVCEMGGSLYDFLREEFNAMIKSGGSARLASPPTNQPPTDNK